MQVVDLFVVLHRRLPDEKFTSQFCYLFSNESTSV